MCYLFVWMYPRAHTLGGRGQGQASGALLHPLRWLLAVCWQTQKSPLLHSSTKLWLWSSMQPCSTFCVGPVNPLVCRAWVTPRTLSNFNENIKKSILICSMSELTFGQYFSHIFPHISHLRVVNTSLVLDGPLILCFLQD